MKIKEFVVSLFVFHELLRVHHENSLYVFKIDQFSSYVVLDPVNAIKKPVKAVANVDLLLTEGSGMVCFQRLQHVLIGDGFASPGTDVILSAAAIPIEHVDGILC